MKSCIRNNDFPLLLLIALCGFTMINTFLFETSGYSTARYFALALVVVSFMLDIDQMYYVIMFCFPLSSILKVSESSITVLAVIYLVLIVKIFVLKKIKLSAGCMISLFLFVFMQMMCIVFYEAKIVSIVSFVLNLLFVVVSARYFNTEDGMLTDIKTAGIFFGFGTAMNVLCCDLFPHIPYMINEVKQKKLDLDNRFAGMVMDPNEFSQILLIAIGCLIAALPLIKLKVVKVLDVAMILYLCINGMRTNSRSYVLALLVMFVVFLLVNRFTAARNKGWGYAILSLLPILVVGVIGVTLIFNKVILPIFEVRAEQQTSLLSGRDEIWTRYFGALSERSDVAVFGCGAGNTLSLLRFVGIQSDTVPHNFYLEYIIQFGVLGLTTLCLVLKDALKSIKDKAFTYSILPFLAFLITAMGISANSNDCLFVLLVLMCMPYRFKDKM